jgi:hypothetical protein
MDLEFDLRAARRVDRVLHGAAQAARGGESIARPVERVPAEQLRPEKGREHHSDQQRELGFDAEIPESHVDAPRKS